MEIKQVKETQERTVNPTLKYQYLIDAHKLLSPCPDKCKPINGVVYRFVNSENITDEDFLPTQIEDDKKTNFRRKGKDNEKSRCLRCAVSLYNTAANAIARLSFLSGRQDSHFTNKLIAKGLLSESDGVASTINDNGHLSFYEYKESKIHLNFEVFKPTK